MLFRHIFCLLLLWEAILPQGFASKRELEVAPDEECVQAIENQGHGQSGFIVPGTEFAAFVFATFDRHGMLTVVRRHLKTHFKGHENFSVTPDDILQELYVFLARRNSFFQLEGQQLNKNDKRVVAYVNEAIRLVILHTRRKEVKEQAPSSIMDDDGQVLQIPELAVTAPIETDPIANEAADELTDIEDILPWMQQALTKARIAEEVEHLAPLYELTPKQFFLHLGGEYSWADLQEALIARAHAWKSAYPHLINLNTQSILLRTEIGILFAELREQLNQLKSSSGFQPIHERIIAENATVLEHSRALVDLIEPKTLNLALLLWEESKQWGDSLTLFKQIFVDKIPLFAIWRAGDKTKQAASLRVKTSFRRFIVFFELAQNYPGRLEYGGAQPLDQSTLLQLILSTEENLNLWTTALGQTQPISNTLISRAEIFETVAARLVSWVRKTPAHELSLSLLQGFSREATLELLVDAFRDIQTTQQLLESNPFQNGLTIDKQVLGFWALPSESRRILTIAFLSHLKLRLANRASAYLEKQWQAFHQLFLQGFHLTQSSMTFRPKQLKEMQHSLFIIYQELIGRPAVTNLFRQTRMPDNLVRFSRLGESDRRILSIAWRAHMRIIHGEISRAPTLARGQWRSFWLFVDPLEAEAMTVFPYQNNHIDKMANDLFVILEELRRRPAPTQTLPAAESSSATEAS